MAGENSQIAFPNKSGIYSKGMPSSSTKKAKEHPNTMKRALRREAGVRVVSTEMKNSPAATEELQRPRRIRKPGEPRISTFDNHDGLAPLSSQLPQEAHDLLEQLDPDDPHYVRKYKGIIRAHKRVWEDIPATPLIIDFSDVLEPINPERLGPHNPRSKHPERPLHQWARKNAFAHDPRRSTAGRVARELWYWEQMDKGMLPPHFNPYAPGSQRHGAFEERVFLRDDRPTTTNMSNLTKTIRHPDGEVEVTRSDTELLDTPRQIRARARRKMAAGGKLTEAEFEAVMGKPIEEWDLEELSQGRPRAKSGKFEGRLPSRAMSREINERIEVLFKQKVRSSMNQTTVTALSVLANVLTDENTDHRGKPTVAASTKADVAKFLVEHLLGKPKQTVESDISTRLQSVLASVMVAPEMALPSDPSQPVGPTGRFFAGQRGSRSDYEDTERLALERAGIIDAEIVLEDDDE